MEFTINIKDRKNIADFLNLIKQFESIEIIDVKEGDFELPIEHQVILDQR